MNRNRIARRLTAWLTAILLSVCPALGGTPAPVFAEEGGGQAAISAKIEGGNIRVTSLDFANGEVTAAGVYSGGYGESIAWLIRGKEDGTFYSIGETRSGSDGDFHFSFELSPEAYFQTMVLEIKAKRETERTAVEFAVTDEQAQLDGLITRTETLLNRCEAEQISTDYERVKYATALKVRDMLPTFEQNGETEAYDFNREQAISLCEEADAALESYLDGSAQPLTAVRTVTDVPEVKGQSFYANRTVDGVPDQGPAFYIGYGHWDTKDLERYKDLGVNLFQYEVGPKDVLKRAAPVADWDLDELQAPSLTYTIARNSGENNGAVQLDSTGSGEVYLSQTIEVEPNTSYTFGVDFKCRAASSIWVRASDGDSKTTLWIYDSRNDGEITEWKSRSSTVTTKPDQTTLTFTIGSHNKMEALMFDNAVVKKTGTDDNLLANPDFSAACNDRFAVKTQRLENIRKVFQRAADSDVGLVFLTAMHYFPAFVYEQDTTVNNSGGSGFPGYMPFNPTHPLVLETLEAFLDAVIPVIRDYPSLHSVCLANEPAFYSNQTSAYYLPLYRKFLQEKYGSIGTLNSAYGKSYNSFDDVLMPTNTGWSGGTGSDRRNTAWFNDYREFNDSIMTEWHQTLRDKVKELAPEVLVHTKGMEYLQAIGNSDNRLIAGIDNEALAKMMDLNGSDAWAYYGQNKDTIQGVTMWYDYLNSIKNVPAINSEDHIIQDSKRLTRANGELEYAMTNLWQGAVHGRSASVLWLYDSTSRSDNSTSFYNANLTRRADYIAAIGKTALDLNRLAEELEAIQVKRPRVAMLYSDNSQVGNPYSLNTMYLVYQKAMAHGEKVFFVNETDPAQLNAREDLELLILPCTNYIKKETLEQIKLFLDGGGKVLMINAGNKSWMDENGQAHDNALLSSVTSRSETVSLSLGSGMYAYDSSGDMASKLNALFSALDGEAVTITSGSQAVEWLAAEYNGGYVINLCNYGSGSANITLTANGYDTAGAVDMISGQTVGGSFALEVNRPMLLWIESTDRFRFYEREGENVGDETNLPSSHTMTVEAVRTGQKQDAAYVHMAGVYVDGVLRQFFTQEGKADEIGEIRSRLDFVIDDNIDLRRCVVKTFLFRSADSMVPLMRAREITYLKQEVE